MLVYHLWNHLATSLWENVWLLSIAYCSHVFLQYGLACFNFFHFSSNITFICCLMRIYISQFSDISHGRELDDCSLFFLCNRSANIGTTHAPHSCPRTYMLSHICENMCVCVCVCVCVCFDLHRTKDQLLIENRHFSYVTIAKKYFSCAFISSFFYAWRKNQFHICLNSKRKIRLNNYIRNRSQMTGLQIIRNYLMLMRITMTIRLLKTISMELILENKGVYSGQQGRRFYHAIQNFERSKQYTYKENIMGYCMEIVW